MCIPGLLLLLLLLLLLFLLLLLLFLFRPNTSYQDDWSLNRVPHDWPALVSPTQSFFLWNSSPPLMVTWRKRHFANWCSSFCLRCSTKDVEYGKSNTHTHARARARTHVHTYDEKRRPKEVIIVRLQRSPSATNITLCSHDQKTWKRAG